MTTSPIVRRSAGFLSRAAFAALFVALTSVATRAQNVAPAPLSPPPTPAELAKYDTNKNGVLDPSEGAALQADRAKQEELVQLNPFEVRATADTGYGALESNSLTAFRMDLEKMPATAQVFTKTFMDDIAATSIQDVLVGYSGTVFDGDPVNAMPGDRTGSGGGLNVRGLPGGAPKRDGLTGTRASFRSANGYTDTFDTERVEIIQGPQSLLYGAAGGGGVINQVSKRAQLNRKAGEVQTRVDQYGSKRGMLDYNYGTEKFAVRVAAVGDKKRDVRYNIGNDFYGLYTQVAYRILPQTTVRAFYERANNWGIVASYPGSGDIFNFFYQHDGSGNIVRNAAGIPLVNTADPRRAQTDIRYLALTGQLADLRGVLWNDPVDYYHLGSFGAWWSSEKVDNKYSGLTVESKLPWGFSLQATGIYTETLDDRVTVGKNLVPAAGFTGSGANPFAFTATRVSPGDNWQSDRTRDIGLTLLHEDNFNVWKLKGHSQTAIRGEWTHQGPAFGSSGMDRLYYRADSNWNLLYTHANGTTDNTPDYTRADYGRVSLSNIYFPIQNGLPLKPVFQPGARRITLGDQNYVLEPRISSDPSRRTDQNPFGLIPNNPTASNPNGYSGNWNRGGETHAGLASIANYTEWMDGKLATLLGASVNRFTTLNSGPGNPPTYLAPHNYWGYQYGANYEVWRGLRAYATISTAGMSAGTTHDFYGHALKVPTAKSPTPEVGLKYYTPTMQVQLAHVFSTEVTNQAINAGTDAFNAVNPNGINGRTPGADQWINLDRKASSTELTVDLNPTHNWRMRLQAVNLDGEVMSTVAYKQLYNDQFSANASGGVTYADGTPLLVDPNGGNAARNTPLTLTMINTSGNPYYANPDPISGSITSSLLKTTLTTVDPVHGKSATGVTGLPLSAMQYAWANPGNGTVTVVQAGDKNTGINEYTFNFQNRYQFSEGFLRGFGVFTDLRTYYKNRAYYTQYFPTGTSNTLRATRVLYRLPSATVINLGLSYHHKLWGRFDRFNWQTQLNMNNALNHYRVWVLPNSSNGVNLQARLSTAPRQFVWTNTISF
jgi:outer membrane receptor protein involved in Fe transport